MMMEIKVPPLGESVVEATVSRIIVDSGSFVTQDQEIIELETDKVNQVLYAPAAGQLSVTVSVGQIVSVAQLIGYVDTDKKGEGKGPVQTKPSAPTAERAPAPIAPPSSARVMVDTFVQQTLSEPKDDKVAPVRVDMPSQERGAISLVEGHRKKMSSLRRTIAARLVEVKNSTAMLTTFNEVDMSAVIAIRAKEKDSFLEKYGVKLGFMSFFVKASVAALKAFTQVNAYIDGDDIVTVPSYDIGVAVSTEKGLFVPVIRGCDTLTFGGIEKGIEMYAKKAREGGIGIDDMRGGSFTITNGGVFGSLLSTPILNPPQSAILGMHSIVKRAVVINDQITIRPMMYLALSYDHRIIDGKEAVQFLVHIKQSLEDPSRLLLEL